MKNGLGFHGRSVSLMRMLPVVTLFAGVVRSPGSAVSPVYGLEGFVRGRVEILNAKVRLHGGQPDAGGVVVWLMPQTPERSPRPLPRKKLEQREKRFIPHVMA